MHPKMDRWLFAKPRTLMLIVCRSVFFLLLLSALTVFGADVPHHQLLPVPAPPLLSTQYFWSSVPVGNTAQLVTLNCRECGPAAKDPVALPLLTVLRDTLGDDDRENDRLSYVWLLNAGSCNVGQRLLSAIPFFYWGVGRGSVPTGSGYPKPLLNLNEPLSPVVSKASRTVVQWTALDPLTTAVRASSRSYQANDSDNERLYLEQAIGYLQSASPTSETAGLSAVEIDTLIARLELRKSMLGGLINNSRVADFGRHINFEEERIRSRNYEVLRELAEKTGTYFEPLSLAGADNYALLWFPVNSIPPQTGVPTKAAWKLLNIRDPWSDRHLEAWEGLSYERAFSEDGRMLPMGASSRVTRTMVPLAVYGLTYPQMPLLLVDFRDRLRVRRHEMTQRTITELTSGVLGLSRFANWYYYVGAMAYQGIWSRQGIAANQSNRLDTYAQFRIQLALDNQLDLGLHKAMSDRARSLVVNPLASDPEAGVTQARSQLARLERAAQNDQLAHRVDRERRAELAAFPESTAAQITRSAFHVLTFGAYTHRVGESSENMAKLDRERRLTHHLDYLDAAIRNGTDPRIAHNEEEIERARLEVETLTDGMTTGPALAHAQATLARLRKLTGKPTQEASRAPAVAQTVPVGQ